LKLLRGQYSFVSA